MSKNVIPKFIDSEGHWFNIIEHGDGTYSIFNTQRKRNQIDRDGNGYDLGEKFASLEEAKKYLDNFGK